MTRRATHQVVADITVGVVVTLTVVGGVIGSLDDDSG
jgi:hypothetical protein